MANLVYFSADDGVHGAELWVTDGTPGGTRMVKDISPYNDPALYAETGSSPTSFTSLGDGRFIFSATDGTYDGRELWISDGTSDGTTVLRNINDGFSSDPRALTPLATGKILFKAEETYDDDELWITDGTYEGTTLVRNINPSSDQYGEHGSQISWLTALGNGRAVFFAQDDVGTKLWTTDGSSQGTQALAEPPFTIWIGALGNGLAVYQIEDRLWVTDGTIGGSRELVGANGEVLNLSNLGSPRLAGDGLVYFSVDIPDGDANCPTCTDVVDYQTDGTLQGTIERHPDPGIDPPSDPDFPTSEGEWTFKWMTGYLGELPSGLHLVKASYWFGRQLIGVDDVLTVTDGTTDGTRPIGDFGNLDDRSISSPDDFDSHHFEVYENSGGGIPSFQLPDGRIVFEGSDYGEDTGLRDDEDRKLLISDGVTASIYLDAENLVVEREFANENIMFSAYDGGGYSTYLASDSGPQLIANHTLTYEKGYTSLGIDVFHGWRPGRDVDGDGFDENINDIWISDGTIAGTHLVQENTHRSLSEATSLGPNKIVTSFGDWTMDPNGDGIGGDDLSPWVIDISTGTMQKLADVIPGATQYSFSFAEISTGADISAPVSTLFPIRLSLEEQPNAFDLDDYFTDPGGDTLDYQVTGLPGDITLDQSTNELSTSAVTQSGTHKIEVTAINDEGTAVTSTFDWSVVDTGKVKIASTGEWVSDVQTKQISSTAGSVITLGHKDGEHGLLRIEGDAGKAGAVTIDKGTLIVKGKVFSEQVSTTKPIMEGEFTINMATLAVSKFKDEKKNNDHRLVDGLIDMQFADLSIYRDKVSFKTDLLFDGSTGGAAPVYSALGTKGAPLAATFGADGIDIGLSAGTQRWAPEPLTLDLGTRSNLTLGFSKIGADYDAASDSIYISGKASLDWGGELDNGFDFIDNDSAQSLSIDLAGNVQQANYFQRGDKFLKLSPATSGGWDWDVVGEIKYENKEKGPLGNEELGVKELKITFDTIKDQYVGSFKAGIPALFPSPFSTSNDILASLGFLTNPSVRLDSFSLGLDGLNLPVGATGVFLQGGTVAMQGLGTLDPKAPYTYQADVTGSWGPSTDTIPSPIRGKIAGQIKLPEIDASVQLDSKVGYFVPSSVNGFAAPLIDYFGVTPSDVTNFVLFDLKAQTKFDVVKGDFSIGGTVQLIGGAVTGQGLVSNFTDAATPTQKNLITSLSGTFKMPDAFPVIGGLERSGNALLKYSADGNSSNDFVAAWTKVSIPLLFTTKVYSFGAQYNFDGSYKVLGNNTIPKTSSWNLDPSVELVILSAEWEVASSNTLIEVIAPDGSVLTETDIAARDDIAIVTDLDSPTSRHVAVYQPEAGTWDLRVADPTGLGTITYDANEMLAGAAAEFVSVTPTPADHSASVEVSATLGDATTAQVTLFASDELGQLGGIELGRYTVTAGSSRFSHDLDYGRLGPGTWYLYARTEADGLSPDVQMYDTPLTISGAADLSLGVTQDISASTDAPVITVDVTNAGDRPSTPGVLVVTVPDTMTGADPIPEFNASPLSTPQSEVALPILAPGESLKLSFALPVGADVSDATIGIDAFTTGADGDMSDNKAAFVLEDTTNQVITGTPGVDALFGGTGDDAIDGLAGIDTARYSGPQISYTLSLSASGDTILTDRRANGDGTDTLENVERLDFQTEIAILNGQPLDLTVFGGPARLFPDDFESFIELYIAYFNRAPDSIGLNFWGTAFSKGTTLSEMATLFVDQPETRATYPEDLSNSGFATAVYNNVLGRIPDQAGFDFWVGALDSQSVGRDQFILAVLDGAKASPPIGASQDFIDQQLADRAYLATKTDIGAYFAVHKGMSNVDNASAAMAFYDGTNTGLTNAVNAIDAFHQSALDPVSGEFLMPLIGVLDDPFALL